MVNRVSFLSLCASAVLAFSATADDCDGDPRLRLEIDETVPIGGSGEVCLTAPDGSVALLMVSTGEGHFDTSYGTICLEFPLLYHFVLPMPNGETCLDFDIPCDPDLIGLKLYLQFIVCDPVRGASNQASIEIIDGICEGDYCTFTQGGWGTSCSGNNPGCRRDSYFDTAFPQGLLLGDADGADGDGEYSVLFQSSAAIEDFLPAGGTPAELDADSTDPLSTSAGVFAGQLAAAKLNVGFDDAGIFDDDKTHIGGPLGDLIYVDGVDDDLIGLSVREVIAWSDLAISGHFAGGDVDLDGDGNADVSLSDLSDALTVLNENFVDCNTNKGNLGLPPLN